MLVSRYDDITTSTATLDASFGGRLVYTCRHIATGARVRIVFDWMRGSSLSPSLATFAGGRATGGGTGQGAIEVVGGGGTAGGGGVMAGVPLCIRY